MFLIDRNFPVAVVIAKAKWLEDYETVRVGE